MTACSFLALAAGRQKALLVDSVMERVLTSGEVRYKNSTQNDIAADFMAFPELTQLEDTRVHTAQTS